MSDAITQGHEMSKQSSPEKGVRKDWDEYFMDIAKQVSSRATCPRKRVGAVVVRDRTILSTGYNSAIRGAEHCDDVGCLMEDGHCVRVVHAETNAIVQAAKNGVNIDGSTVYTIASPCWPCFKILANAGIKRIVYLEFYRDERIFNAAKLAQIELLHFRRCCGWHKSNPGPWSPKDREDLKFRGVKNPDDCRCLNVDCNPCNIERSGCGCDGALDDGCFLCTPTAHKRPKCESLKEKTA